MGIGAKCVLHTKRLRRKLQHIREFRRLKDVELQFHLEEFEFWMEHYYLKCAETDN